MVQRKGGIVGCGDRYGVVKGRHMRGMVQRGGRFIARGKRGVSMMWMWLRPSDCEV